MDDINQLSVGIDLGDRVSEACVLRAGVVVDRFKVPMLAEEFVRAFGDRPRCAVALEAGAQCAWVTRTLEALGFEVVIANPRKVTAISANIRKNDKNDAELLARLVAVDRSLLSPIHLRDEVHQRALERLGARHALVKTRTRIINHIRSRAKAMGTRLRRTDAANFAGLESTLPDALQPSAAPMFRILHQLNEEIRQFDEELMEIAERDYPATRFLQTIKGVGPVTSLAFVLVLGQHDRFPSGRYAAAYLGLVPRQDQSGSGDRQLGISKAGNTFVRALLVQCAHSILGRNGDDSDLRRWGHAIAERGGKNAKKRATIATARKLAVLTFSLWKRSDTWKPLHNAAASPPALTTPAEGCPDVPVLDDCAWVLDQPGRSADCSIERGSDPSMHRAQRGPSTSANRSMDRGATSTGKSASATQPRSSTRSAKRPVPHKPTPPEAQPPIEPTRKTASRAFDEKKSGESSALAGVNTRRSTLQATPKKTAGGSHVH